MCRATPYYIYAREREDLVGQYFKPVFGHDKGVFPLCRGQFVFGHDGPAILFVNKDLPRAHIDHRFDGKNHTRHKEHAVAACVPMLHLGLFVKLQSHAVPTEIAHHAETVFVGVSGYGLANVADEATQKKLF